MCALLCAVLLGMAADADPIARIHREIAAGRKEIAVPCARYWLTPPDGSTYYLALRGLSGATTMTYSWDSPQRLSGARLVFDSEMTHRGKRMRKLEAHVFAFEAL